MRSAERGAVLFEVVVALTVLLVAGVSVIALLGALLQSEDQLRRREADVQQLDRLLTAMSLLTRADLDRRLGHHPAGPFDVDVQRPEATLYRVAVSRRDRGGTEVLATVIYRPDTDRP